MTEKERLQEMAKTCEAYLKDRLLPFWTALKDDQNGGFVGYVDYGLKKDPAAVRGCILNSRILWFYSRAYRLLRDPELLRLADHAYRELLCMTDVQNGGVFWSVMPDGTPEDTTKHTYNQAFAIYALSAYAEVSGRRGALEQARALFRVIETRMRDDGGYLEAFDAGFHPAGNDKLSENGVEASRTMNTLLHVLEGYTELYRVGRDPEVRERLYRILEIWRTKIWNPQRSREEVFFDHEYNTLIDLHSYGHDIETSWLADRTLEVLDDPELTALMRPMLLQMADEILTHAWTEGNGLPAECERGKNDETRVWWVQAETVLGFLNAWQKTGEARWLDAAENQLNYVFTRIADPRPGSEWFWSVDQAGRPIEKPIVEPWKCPYHNGRMIFEIMERSRQ